MGLPISRNRSDIGAVPYKPRLVPFSQQAQLAHLETSHKKSATRVHLAAVIVRGCGFYYHDSSKCFFYLSNCIASIAECKHVSNNVTWGCASDESEPQNTKKTDASSKLTRAMGKEFESPFWFSLYA